MLRPPLLLLPLLLVLPGCVVFQARFGARVPADEAVAALRPGETTRAQAVALLGPPEEYRTPRDFEALRSEDPRRLMVSVERDALARRRLTWIDERRVTEGLWLLPGMPLLHWWDTRFDVDTLVVFFDDQDRVEAVTRGRSRQAEERLGALPGSAAGATTEAAP